MSDAIESVCRFGAPFQRITTRSSRGVLWSSLRQGVREYFTSGVQGLIGSGDTNRIMVGALTRIYADTSVRISRFDDSSTDPCQVTLSGHLQVISPQFPG
jgi:hypothetical protein